jgi:Cys-rich protein (TIGR01571 family)
MSSVKQKYEPVSTDGNGLDESFIATATAVGSPYTTEARPYLQVVSPATLPEGYTFEAQANGQAITVTVPMGGIEEGQKFDVPVPPGSNINSGARPSGSIGHWKDDLIACCGLGCCHPTLWMAWCCPMILLGQIMTRLKLTWTAQPDGSRAQTASTFRILCCLWMLWLGLRFLPNYMTIEFLDENGDLDAKGGVLFLIFSSLVMALSILFFVLVCKTRRHIREKYQIPEQQCHGCEDCCCTYWCSCCTIAQMARHTGDYAAYGSRCCSETGLPPSHPSIV